MNRILIVDDVLELGRFLQAALATVDKNLNIRVMATAEEALLEATRQSVDLLVTEVRLPGISGIDLARRIQQRYPQVKIIFISTLTNKKIDQQIEELHASAYFHKPMQIPRFLEAASQALGIRPAWEREEEESGDVAERLSNRLAGLRHTLHAVGVYLLDDRGRVIAQAGEEFENTLEKISSPLMTALNANIRLARLLGKNTPGFSCALQGEPHDIVFAPVGDFALLLTLEADEASTRIALAYEEVLRAQGEITRILQEMGVQTSVVPEKATVEQETDAFFSEPVDISLLSTPSEKQDDEVFASKLNQMAKKINRQSADTFWREQVTSGKMEPLNPDIISYEQAVQLGIAPLDEENELPAEEE